MFAKGSAGALPFFLLTMAEGFVCQCSYHKELPAGL